MFCCNFLLYLFAVSFCCRFLSHYVGLEETKKRTTKRVDFFLRQLFFSPHNMWASVKERFDTLATFFALLKKVGRFCCRFLPHNVGLENPPGKKCRLLVRQLFFCPTASGLNARPTISSKIWNLTYDQPRTSLWMDLVIMWKWQRDLKIILNTIYTGAFGCGQY